MLRISLPINSHTERAIIFTYLSRHLSPRWSLRGKLVCLSGDSRRTTYCPAGNTRSVHDGDVRVGWTCRFRFDICVHLWLKNSCCLAFVMRYALLGTSLCGLSEPCERV